MNGILTRRPAGSASGTPRPPRERKLGTRRFFRFPRVEPLEDRRLLAAFTVTTTLDAGAGSLRQAILDANAAPEGGTIQFNIPATDPNHIDVDAALAGGDAEPDVWRIQPLTELPALANLTSGITIDGRTQTAFGGNLNPLGPEIVLDGNGLDARGLVISTGDHAVLGLNIQRFGRSGIVISAGDRNVVAGNYIGVDATGTTAAGNSRWGVSMDTGATNNRIGTNADGVDDAAERNVLSGNGFGGIGIVGASNDDNVISGNYIGTNAGGTAAIGNANRGVDINGGSKRNRIGTNADGVNDLAERNLISGNGWAGVGINGVGASFNVVAGNLIGTDITGNAALGNSQDGIILFGAATNNRIGGGVAAARNIISGNTFTGIRITGAGTSSNNIAGNYIGTDLLGAAAIANVGGGLLVDAAASGNWIGTDEDGVADAGEGNVISGNGATGIRITGANVSQNVVAGNLIGTTAAGTSPLGNVNNGIGISAGAKSNRIGTDGDGLSDLAERNIISGNTNRGIVITGTGSDSTIVAGNFIGTNAAGTAAVGNGLDGIQVELGAKSTRIGTDGNGQGDVAERNVISGNGLGGVVLFNPDTSLHLVAGNFIGTSAEGTADLGNGNDGVRISGGARDNTIGGTGPLANTIAFNKRSGVGFIATALAGNAVLGNTIHSNGGLGIDIGIDGVTPNDVDDADGGPNQAQNFPEIGSAVLIGEALTVTYAVNSTVANSTYPLRIELFEADSGGQEGQRFLGFDVLTGASAAKTFVLAGITGLTAGERLVATATDANGNTSEFSIASIFEPRINPWHNAANPLDVDDSGGQAPVSAIDAVLVINLLNAGLGGPVPVDEPIGPPFLDVSGDGFVAPLDAVLVINFLNAQARGQSVVGPGEGETPGAETGRAERDPEADSYASRDGFFAALADEFLPSVRRRRSQLS